MHITVYADILFLTNFLSNLFLLTLTEKIVRTDTRRLRRIVAAALGGVYACAAFLPQLTLLQSFVCRILAAGAMLCIAFRFHSYKHFLRCALLFTTALLLSGGCCYVLFFMTQLGIKTGAVLKSGIFYWHVPAHIIVLAFTAAYGLLFAFEKLITFYAARKQNLHTLRIVTPVGGVTLPALLDTGNALYDTASMLPVIIAEAKCFPMHAPQQHIPYRTLAGETHFMPVLRPLHVEIDGQRVGDCMLALTQTQLSSDGSFRALIHPALIQGESNS